LPANIFLSDIKGFTMRFIFSPILEEHIIFFRFMDHCHSTYRKEKCRFCNADAGVGIYNFQYPFNYVDTLGDFGLWICRDCESYYRCYRPDIEEIESAATAFETRRQSQLKTYIKTLVIPDIGNIINDFLEDIELL
jgi:hypothetical protein